MERPATISLEDKRAKRAARRAQQREQNIGRAAKMHQLRIADASLTPFPEMQTRIPTHNVGCSGWFYWHWGQTFYGRIPQTRNWFRHYASHFRTVELNAPFYSWPTAATVQKWLRDVKRRRFLYTVKVCELITHKKRFFGTKTLIEDFYFIAKILGSRMGCFLFQLPPSFHYSKARLGRIVSQLNPAFRNVVEFRHSSWWNETVYAAFRDAGIIFCSSSGPRLPDQLVRTADDVYIRFHGTTKWYRHDYSRVELETWVRRVTECGARHVWAYFNNDRDAFSIRNARMFLRLLKAAMPSK